MATLSFCAECGERRVREVREQLQELFLSKQLRDDFCGICCKQLTGKNPNVTEQQPANVENMPSKTVDNSKAEDMRVSDDDDDFFDPLETSNDEQYVCKLKQEAQVSSELVASEPHCKDTDEQSTPSIFRRSTRSMTGTLKAKNVKLTVDKSAKDAVDSEDDNEFDPLENISDDSDEKDVSYEPEEDSNLTNMKVKSELKSKKVQIDITNTKSAEVKQEVEDPVTVNLSSGKDASDIHQPSEESLGMDGNKDNVKDEQHSEVQEDDHVHVHVSRASLETRALVPEVLEVMATVQDPEKPYQCKFCNKKPFASVILFMRHVSTKHGELKQIKEPFQCKKCGAKFDAIRKWYCHTKEKPYKCKYPSCDAAFTLKYNLLEHLNVHKDIRPHPCLLCKMSFRSSSALKKHNSVVHEKIKRFVCEFCGWRFGALITLKVHERRHTNERPFKCDKCDQAFMTKLSLQSHLLDHTGHKPFVCDICGHASKTKNTFESHLTTHSGEQPWQCQTCGQRFKRQNTMKKHQETIHEKMKTKKCRYCDERFSYDATRRQHEKTHPEWTGLRKFVCKTCGLDCQTKEKLKIHTRKHTGEKPYHCKLCNYSSAWEKNMRTHMRRHTGEKPYRCQTCDKQFMYYQQCKDHKSTCNSYKGNLDSISPPVVKEELENF